MSEARKCDRCHGFYDIAEEQQDRKTPYEFKGDYVNLHLWVARNGIRKDVMSQWYDICPKCMMELEGWLENNEFPTNCEPEAETEDKPTITDPECCGDCYKCTHFHTHGDPIERKSIVACMHYKKKLYFELGDITVGSVTPLTFKDYGEALFPD